MQNFLVLATVLVLILAPQRAAVAQQAATISSEKQATKANAGGTKLQNPATDLLALMKGRCSKLSVAGRDFACRTVGFAHNTQGRAYFTIALDDVADQNHIISFSGENGQRTTDNLYDLTIDRMLINSSDRPKVDGLPVPAAVTSAGRCVQLGTFASRVSSVVCSATDEGGKKYELRFEPDDSPIMVRRVNPSAPTIRG
jgi:hypothetical protein